MFFWLNVYEIGIIKSYNALNMKCDGNFLGIEYFIFGNFSAGENFYSFESYRHKPMYYVLSTFSV